ncbi:MAG TPA: membrane dipeptidase, partial [Cyclobacteriaceae bacterium]|nr:membrane dipeptidase [Cyclobacteriaceae bacterium]
MKSRKISRRGFLQKSGTVIAGIGLSRGFHPFRQTKNTDGKGPYDYIIVEGHRDIWEFNDRFALREDSQNSPLRDFILPRLLEGGVDVVIMPAGGDSVDERGGSDYLLKGSMQVTDMLLTEIEKCGGNASIIRTRNDIPVKPDKNHVSFFLDLEGGGSIEIDPEPGDHPDRRLALLRNFFRLGIRGMQLTHNGRNQLGDGIAEGKMGGKLSKFGVEVVKEMNRLGMMIGVSHLSANGIFHAAEISTKPIVSTHTNLQKFINTPRQHSDAEAKAISGTGGIVGIRYIVHETSYEMLADEIDYMASLIGVEHIGIGWLGHDAGHPDPGNVPGYSNELIPGEVEGQTMYQHWENFIRILE